MMSPERWKVVGEVFDQALLLQGDSRRSYVEELAGDDDDLRLEVLSLLASHHTQGSSLGDGIREAVFSFNDYSSTSHLVATRVGPYRLIRELGAGGMGVVFLAERCDDQYTAQVAIKLIRPGTDTAAIVARFRQERQTLAMLQHRNIARLLDGGTTDTGLPYFVLEYVDGISLKEYVRGQSMSLRRRIDLFLNICSAVDYAHRNFIIHRDIKPDNILIDATGHPKLLDFGICKLLENKALSGLETHVQIMTPNYASPEQISGDALTLSTDIYSLGVVLYELVSGILPHDFHGFTVIEIRRVCCDAATALPSIAVDDKNAARLLRGDIDTIVMRALAHEPQDRYATVAQLAEDLRRYLTDEPILAKPPTFFYKSWKFVRRHNTLVASIAAVVLSLSAGLGVSIKQTRTAHRRLQEVQALAGKLIFDVHDAIEDLPGSTRARALVIATGMNSLDLVAGAIQGDIKAQIDLARSYRRLGDVQGNVLGANLGNTSSAMESYEKALVLLDKSLRATPRSQAAHTEQVMVYQRIGRIGTADGHANEASSRIHEGILLGEAFVALGQIDFRSSLAALYVQSAQTKRFLKDFQGSLEDAQKGLRLLEQNQQLNANDATTRQSLASTYAAIGMAESSLGHLIEAQAHFRQGASVMEAILASNPRSVTAKRELMLAYGHLADIAGNPGMHNLGDRAGALAGYRRAMDIGRQLHESDPADQRATLDYAIVLSRVETMMEGLDPLARIAVQQESMRVFEVAARTDPQNVSLHIYQALEYQHLGDALLEQGETVAARAAYLRSIAFVDHDKRWSDLTELLYFISSHSKLAHSEILLGHRKAALDSAQEALDALPASPLNLGQHTLIPRASDVKGKTYLELSKSRMSLPGDRDQARIWLKQSLAAWQSLEHEATFGEAHRREMQIDKDLLAKL